MRKYLTKKKFFFYLVWNSIHLINYYYIGRHRRAREQSVLDALEGGAQTIFEILEKSYADVDSKFWLAASSNVRLHVDHLAHQGKLPQVIGSTLSFSFSSLLIHLCLIQIKGTCTRKICADYLFIYFVFRGREQGFSLETYLASCDRLFAETRTA